MEKNDSYYINGLFKYLTGWGFEVIKIDIRGDVMFRAGETLYTTDYDDLQYEIHFFEPDDRRIIECSTEFDLY